MTKKKLLLAVVGIVPLLAIEAVSEMIEIKDVQVNLITKLRVPVREAGVVDEVLVKPGDIVRKDDPLVQMDDLMLRVQLEAALMQAQLAELDSRNDVDLRFARKSEAVTRAELERMLQANRNYARSISRTELQQTKLSAERSELAAEQAERDLDAKRLTVELKKKQAELLTTRAEMMKVLAPIDGMIVDVFPEVGGFVQTGAPVARLIQLDKLRVEGFVDGRNYDQSLQGSAVTLTVNLPPAGKPIRFEGEVTFVSPEMNPVTHQIRFWADIDNPDLHLRPGSRGVLEIELSQ